MKLTAEAKRDPARVRLTLENDSDAPATLLTSVKTGNRTDYDWFSLVIRVGGVERILRFIGNRANCKPSRETIAAGGKLRFIIDDLAFWAQQVVNKVAKLPKGQGTVQAVYEVQGHPGVWNGRLESEQIAVDWSSTAK